MTGELFTNDGERKYLTAAELDRFIGHANQHERGCVRSFCLTLAYTGCRISEALALTTQSVDLEEEAITFRTLKQRDKVRWRSVTVPQPMLDTLELVHGIRREQRSRRKPAALWAWGRTQGWKHVKACMDAVGVSGVHATPKGLRHGFGVRAIQTTRNPRLVQKWLGHTTLEMTTIYMDVIGQEEREAARLVWQ